MRTSLPIVLVSALLCGGCMTAIRTAEKVARRGAADEENARPARRGPTGPLPEIAGGGVIVKPGHPRLFVGSDWPTATDDVSRDWQHQLRERADKRSADEPIAYSAKKLLGRSREALKRLSLVAGVYRFTREEKYAQAGKRELLNVCAFEDWQPDDFLATSEMMTAVSIGYDWLYDSLTPGERKKVVAAIAKKGLAPALDAYASQGGWTRARHNWNLVCNGGVIVASLAIAEEDPALAKKMLNLALGSIRYGLSAYDDHGGTAEGPMYHSYATRYLTFAAAALKTAADDERLQSTSVQKNQPHGYRYPNWTGAGTYRLAMFGPSGKVANFGDGNEILGNTAWMFWLGQTFLKEKFSNFQTKADRDDPSIFDLLWYFPNNATTGGYISYLRYHPIPDALRDGGGILAKFDSAIVLRGQAGSQNFLAVRTGSTSDHHSHLDLGNFVLDLAGERFAHDLGPDNYGLPGYLGLRRADYLRSSTPGHNTLTLGEASQPLDADSKATVGKADGIPSARVDLTEAYPGAKSVVRTFELNGSVATITDDVRLDRAASLVWHLHTPAKVKKTRGGAALDVNGKRAELRVLEPADATLTIEPDATEPPELPVENSTHVRVNIPSSKATKIVVEIRLANE